MLSSLFVLAYDIKKKEEKKEYRIEAWPLIEAPRPLFGAPASIGGPASICTTHWDPRLLLEARLLLEYRPLLEEIRYVKL